VTEHKEQRRKARRTGSLGSGASAAMGLDGVLGLVGSASAALPTALAVAEFPVVLQPGAPGLQGCECAGAEGFRGPPPVPPQRLRSSA